MKCTNCGKIIKDEMRMIRVTDDGDFVCSKSCKREYESDKNDFFDNIDDDNYMSDFYDK